MVVIGVTGGVGTGKSTVARLFGELGAAVIDADALAHQVMEPKRVAWKRVVQAFGEGILNDDRTINRTRLAALVFADAGKRLALERIVHPPVTRLIEARVRRLRRSRRVRAVVLDVPLLVEAEAQGLVDALVVVTATPTVQRRRLNVQRGWSDEEIMARRGAQRAMSAKVELADHVVENSGSVAATRTQVKRIWTQRVPPSSNRPR
jgi:dephospho-CoA kinase